MRRAFTIIELLLAMAILGMVVVAAGVLTQTAYQASEHTQAVEAATQNARVGIQRITQTVRSAYATGDEPGAAVVETIMGAEAVPRTLVVWAPSGDPENPAGPPMVKELVIYTPNPSDPSELWEMTEPTHTGSQSLTTINSPIGRNLVNVMTVSETATKRVVMRRLQQVEFSGAPTAMVRFSLQMRPTAGEWTNLDAGTLAWADANWPNLFYGDEWGTRSVHVQMEFGMTIAPQADTQSTASDHSLPFFGSATLSYRLEPPSS
ncbi:MAG: type II secretion system GspH family protein [Pirellulales bacterium]|nr:type II secretion system GspH family protein [Pirellulales bacterium]